MTPRRDRLLTVGHQARLLQIDRLEVLADWFQFRRHFHEVAEQKLQLLWIFCSFQSGAMSVFAIPLRE